MNIYNKTILITGGGSGIGKALTHKLHAMGNKLIVVGRSQQKLDLLSEELPNITCYSCDLSNTEERKNLIETMYRKYSDLSILINNAGIMEVENLNAAACDPSSIIRQTEINFYAPVDLSQGLMTLLLKQNEPAIVNITTALVYIPFAATPAYCASKSALSSYTKSLRIQYEHQNLRVFEVLPPLVDTSMANELGKKGMNVNQFANHVAKSLLNDQMEIRIGQAKALYIMHKYFKRFIQKKMNKSAFHVLNKAT